MFSFPAKSSHFRYRTLSQTLRYVPVPVPVPFPGNCQTACDDRLKAGPLRGRGQPPGFGRVGPGPSGTGEYEPSGTSGTLYLFSGISYEKNVHKKDPGNCWQCAGCAGTCPVRCLVYRSIAKRRAMTGSGLGRYKESRPAPRVLAVTSGPDIRTTRLVRTL